MSDSHWVRTTFDAGCPSLARSLEADVVVIGGGLTGLHVALKVLEDDASKKVVLLEADQICGDASGRTMGKVTTSHSRVFSHLSDDAGKKYVQANKEGLARIFDLIETYAIDCDLQRVANYLFASTDSQVGQIRKDFESMKRSGLDVAWIEPRDSESGEIPLEFLACISHPEQAVYHPRKFALGLLRSIQFLGGAVYERTVVIDIEEHRRGVTVAIDGGASVEAKKAVVATRIGLPVEEPFMDSVSVWRKHIGAYLFEYEPIKNSYIRYGSSPASFRSNGSYLLVGGGDEKALPFEDEKHYKAIEAWVHYAFPRLEGRKTEQDASSWWGEDADSIDMLPLIGAYRKDSEHAFMATGYCGWGMAKSAFSGIMLTDLVAGRTSSYQACFDPWRF